MRKPRRSWWIRKHFGVNIMNNLYKGYIKTKNKQAAEKFKGRTDFKTLDEVHNLPEYAGILAENTIFVDVDDSAQSEILMQIVEGEQLNCRVICTSRGKHFIFKNHVQKSCRTHCTLAIGLTADIKVGYVASYEVLKVDGEERFVEWDVPDDTVPYQEIPKWLLPVKGKASFIDMAAGDGRNQQLFSYILTLQSAGFTVEEARDTIRLINKYILKDPLPDAEIDTILRDEAFQKPVFFKNDGKTFLFDVFAEFLRQTEHIINLNGNLHIWHDGVYMTGNKEIEHIMIRHLPGLTDARRREVIKYLALICEPAKPADARYIAFNNGIYDLVTGTMQAFSPDLVITNKIPWNYNPDAESDLVDKILNNLSCDDPAIRLLLEECIGYCFYRHSEMSKAFILIGEKSNGKSTYLDLVKAVLGEENVSSLDLKELGDRFSTSMMFGKLANIGDDIGDDFMQGNRVATFKKVVSGNYMKAERKGQDPFNFSPYVKLLFSANRIPRMKDKTGAVLRRLVIIPFNAVFTRADKGYDPYIKYKIIDDSRAMEYLVLLGIRGLLRILKNLDFTQSDKVDAELEAYEIENNPILAFIHEVGLDGILHEETDDVYKRYTVFCRAGNYQEVSKNTFSKEINRRLGTRVKDTTINGNHRYFYEIGG